MKQSRSTWSLERLAFAGSVSGGPCSVGWWLGAEGDQWGPHGGDFAVPPHLPGSRDVDDDGAGIGGVPGWRGGRAGAARRGWPLGPGPAWAGEEGPGPCSRSSPRGQRRPLAPSRRRCCRHRCQRAPFSAASPGVASRGRPGLRGARSNCWPAVPRDGRGRDAAGSGQGAVRMSVACGPGARWPATGKARWRRPASEDKACWSVFAAFDDTTGTGCRRPMDAVEAWLARPG